MNNKEYLKKYFPRNYKVYSIKENSFNIWFYDDMKNNFVTKSYKTAKYVAKQLRKQIKKDLKITIYYKTWCNKYFIDVEGFEPYMILGKDIIIYSWYYNKNNYKSILPQDKIIHIL